MQGSSSKQLLANWIKGVSVEVPGGTWAEASVIVASLGLAWSGDSAFAEVSTPMMQVHALNPQNDVPWYTSTLGDVST